jgi:hypothetical protein
MFSDHSSSVVYENPVIDDEDTETIIGHLNDKSYLGEIKDSISIIKEKLIKDKNDKKDFEVILENIKSIYKNIIFYYSIIEKNLHVSSTKNVHVSNNVGYKKTDYIICLNYFEEIIKEVNDLIDKSNISKAQKFLFFSPIKDLNSLKDKITQLKEEITKNGEIVPFGGKKNKITKRRLKRKVKVTKRRFKNKKTKRRFPC